MSNITTRSIAAATLALGALWLIVGAATSAAVALWCLKPREAPASPAVALSQT